MATQTTNRIAADIPADVVASIKKSLDSIGRQLPFLIGLTPEERQSLPKIDVVNNIFVTDALTAAQNNADILPAYLKLADMAQDKQGYDALDELVTLTAQLAQKLRDTQILMGSEAYVSALTVYRLFESAARDGVPGAQAVYSQLADRFRNQGNTASAPGNVENGPAA